MGPPAISSPTVGAAIAGEVLFWIHASAITIALLVVGFAIAGLADSFWLIYWAIVAVFTALAWGIVGPLRDRWRRNKRQGEKSADSLS